MKLLPNKVCELRPAVFVGLGKVGGMVMAPPTTGQSIRERMRLDLLQCREQAVLFVQEIAYRFFPNDLEIGCWPFISHKINRDIRQQVRDALSAVKAWQTMPSATAQVEVGAAAQRLEIIAHQTDLRILCVITSLCNCITQDWRPWVQTASRAAVNFRARYFGASSGNDESCRQWVVLKEILTSEQGAKYRSSGRSNHFRSFSHTAVGQKATLWASPIAFRQTLIVCWNSPTTTGTGTIQNKAGGATC